MRKKTDPALLKLSELLTCGNERIELSAAKELLSLPKDDEQSECTESKIELEVNIKIV